MYTVPVFPDAWFRELRAASTRSASPVGDMPRAAKEVLLEPFGAVVSVPRAVHDVAPAERVPEAAGMADFVHHEAERERLAGLVERGPLDHHIVPARGPFEQPPLHWTLSTMNTVIGKRIEIGIPTQPARWSA